MSEDNKKTIRIAYINNSLAASEMIKDILSDADLSYYADIEFLSIANDGTPRVFSGDTYTNRLSISECFKALRNGRYDMCVHCLDDLPVDIPDDLPVIAYLHREDPRNVLVLPKGVEDLDYSLPVGVPDLRCAVQVKELFPGIKTQLVRGSIENLIRKLDEGRYSALILDAAELKRQKLTYRISRYFGPEEIVPAPCHGILCIQGRAGDDYSYLAAANDESLRCCALAERAFIYQAGYEHDSPDTAFAWVSNDMINITGIRYDQGTDLIYRENLSGPLEEAESCGTELADRISDRITPESHGKVWLVGAGPGDAMLLTLKAKDVLGRAEVVIYDEYVGKGVLSFIPESAEMICAGKHSGHNGLNQNEINSLMIEKALEGKRVIRLENGDPFVFGRGGEELEKLAEAGITYEIVPGITSAFAVPAFAGIPVTHRKHSSSVHIVSGRRSKDRTHNIDFPALTEMGGTLVFLMGVSSIPLIAGGLLSAGMDPDIPAAVIEKGTTFKQRIIISTLQDLEKDAAENRAVSPAVIVVGETAALADSLAWKEKLPLAGTRTVVIAADDMSFLLTNMLRDKGAEVIELPVYGLNSSYEDDSLNNAVNNAASGRFEWIIFTSSASVSYFMEKILVTQDIRSLSYCKIACMGKESEESLRKYGIKADLIHSVNNGIAFGREISKRLNDDDRILIPGTRTDDKDLTAFLSSANSVTAFDLPTFDTDFRSLEWFDRKEIFRDPNTFAVFTCTSDINVLASSSQSDDHSYIKAVCINRNTAAEAAKFGIQTFISAEATFESIITKLTDINMKRKKQ